MESDLEDRVAELEEQVNALKRILTETLSEGAVFRAPLSVVDSTAKRLLFQVVDSEAGPVMRLYDERGNPAVQIGSIAERACTGMFLHDPDGAPRGMFVITNGGGSLSLHCPDGQTHVALDTSIEPWNDGTPSQRASVSVATPKSCGDMTASREKALVHINSSNDPRSTIWIAAGEGQHGIQMTYRSAEGWKLMQLHWDEQGRAKLGMCDREGNPVGTPIDIDTFSAGS